LPLLLHRRRRLGRGASFSDAWHGDDSSGTG
jgi:hypothetical protein